METADNSTARALRNFGLVAAASLAAASIWATTAPGEAYLLDAQLWQEEVAGGGDWPSDGWYRLVARERSIEVTAVRPGDHGAALPADALFLRLPGTALKQGERASYRYPAALARPRLGQDYELTLGKTRFSLRVENVAKGMQYAIGYGGQAYSYVLGPFDAGQTSVRAVADLDGDAMPDFLVDVDAATYLLLSTRAVPGSNLPAAELWARNEGC